MVVRTAASVISGLRGLPIVMLPLGSIPSGAMLMPIPILPLWPSQADSAAPSTIPMSMAERTARVNAISISPQRLVGYVGETVTFVAMGKGVNGQPAHGAKFQWESSDSGKLTIDEAGRATMLRPGMVIVTASAGAMSQAAPVLIRPFRRPLQTDQQWRDDQGSLVSAVGGEDEKSGVLASLIDRVMPTAHSQFNPWGDNPHAAGQIGTPPFTALEPTRLGPVIPQNNFELPIPLSNLGGRGLATNLMLYYNSSVWGSYFDPNRNANVYAFDPIQSWPSPGFSLGFGRVTYYDFSNYPGIGSGYKYMLIDPNGTHHDLGIGSDTGTNSLQTTDGSHITYAGNALGGTLYSNDGTAVTIGKVNNRLLPTQITDTNGNFIQIGYHWETNFPPMAINYIVDTMGRVIQFNYGEWPAPSSTSLSSISTPSGVVTLGYQTVTMNPNFLLVNNPIENMPSNFYAISSVTIPQRPASTFTYSGYGMIYNIVATGGGGTATVTYDYPQGGDQVLWPTFSHRTESGSPNAVYTYGSDGSITRPDGTVLILSGSSAELRSATGSTLSKTASTLTTDPGGSTALQSVIRYDNIGQQTKVDFDYDQYGNIVNQRECGFQIGGAWKVRRRTHYSYVNWEPYLSAYIRNRLTETDVYDALQNTSDADDVLVGKTVIGYDSYSAMGGMENYGGTAAPPGHLSSYGTSTTTRGNVTGVTTYSDLSGGGVTRSNKVDIFGGVTKAQLSCCNQKSFTMSEATYWAKPIQTTSGDSLGIHLTTNAVYDFSTLTTTSQTDPDSQTTSYSYDVAQRPAGFTSPTGATGTINYNAFGEKTSSTFSYTEGGIMKTISTSAVYDGWGQLISTVDANGAQVNYSYDNMGHRLTQTNPFPQGGTPGPSTSYAYDLLSRTTLVTLPGGNTIQTAYTGGNIAQVTDQVNRKMQRESDSLGRLVKVTEQDVTTGNLTQETSYTYDIADHLIGVSQGNQTRAYKYDAGGHLLYERIPEMTATINDGTGTYWTTRYTYNDFGSVATKTDARGVIITYGYDILNRLASVTYNTSGAPGVASTPNVTCTYDTNQSSSTNGLLLSVSVGSSYSESYGYDSVKRVQSLTRTIDSRTYATSFQFDGANQLTQITYPSNRAINIGHDSKGRVTSVAGYLSSVTYDGIGRMAGTTLGNGVTEGFGYDTNRMQLASQTATRNGGPTNGLMNLTYGYDAAAGQTGTGSLAGNAGHLMSITGTVNSTTESAAYNFDDLGRLVTSNQASNGSSAQRRYAYDRWGNRTGTWDAVSGGSQLQSVSLKQSGGAPTNQIQTVTSGSTVNYIYDAAGNLTNDGAHLYTYDAENRIVSVDAGSTATYAYDQSNQRFRKTAGSAVTHYIWHGSQVIAEHNGNTGASMADYVYSGTRLIARTAGLSTQYFLSDRLSVRLTLNVSGSVIGRQSHLPFGEDFGESGSQTTHHFTSYERDAESGSDYADNRQYSQNVGRFMSSDRDHGSTDLRIPQSFHRYSYVRNEPIDAKDPLGLNVQFLEDCIGIPLVILNPETGGIAIVGFTGYSVCSIGSNNGNRTDPGDGKGKGKSVVRSNLPPITGKEAKRVTDAETRASDLTKNSDCDKALEAFGIPSLAALVADLKIGAIDGNENPSGNIFDGRVSEYQDYVRDDDGSQISVRGFFKKHPDTVAITTDGTGGLVFLGSLFFSESDYDRAITLIHESVHRAGLRDTAFGATRDQGSHSLTALIKAKCH